MKYTHVILTLLLVFTPVLASAETVLRVSDSVAISDDQTIAGDFYGAAGIAGPVSISGLVDGDAFVIGSTVTANGEISADLFSLSGVTQVHGVVTDDVRIISGEVTLADFVGGDVFIISGTLKMLSTAEVAGNVFFYGGEAELNGSIGGSVFGTSERLRIDGPVAGDVDVTVAQELVIGARADITGNVIYTSPKELVRAQSAVIVGDVVSNSQSTITSSPEELVMPFIVYAFMVLVVFVIFRDHTHMFKNMTGRSFARDGLIGLAAFFVLPPVIVLLFISMLGSLVGMLVLFGTITLYLLALPLLALVAGSIVTRFMFKAKEVTFISALLGIVSVGLLAIVPMAGPAIIFTLFMVVLGTLLRRLYHLAV